MNNDARRHDRVIAAGNRRLNGIPARRPRDVRDVRDTSERRLRYVRVRRQDREVAAGKSS